MSSLDKFIESYGRKVVDDWVTTANDLYDLSLELEARGKSPITGSREEFVINYVRSRAQNYTSSRPYLQESK